MPKKQEKVGDDEYKIPDRENKIVAVYHGCDGFTEPIETRPAGEVSEPPVVPYLCPHCEMIILDFAEFGFRFIESESESGPTENETI